MLVQAAVVAAPARVAIGVDRRVTHFARHAVQNPPAGDDPPADARAQRQQDERIDILAGTDPLLAHGRRVGVVLQEDRRAQPPADLVAHGEPIKLGQVARPDDQPFLHFNKPRHGHAHARQARLAFFRDRRPDRFDDVFHHRFAPFMQVRSARNPAQNRAVLIDRSGAQIRPAKVDTDRVALRGHEAE